MPESTRIVAPGRRANEVIVDGTVLPIPAGWVLVPPGDPGLTRRIKADGPTWTVQEKRGRKLFSRGVWAPGDRVEAIRAQLAIERADPAHARKQEAATRRREKVQDEYVEDFRAALLAFLGFDARYADLAERLATAVTEHATPVGSGTVARTKRIPVEERAEAAVIAWMRHQTTAYDRLNIPRVKGERREVRRMLAQKSKSLLEAYRRGLDRDPATCPLQLALPVTGTS